MRGGGCQRALKVRALEGRVGPLCASQGDPGVSKRVAGRMWTLFVVLGQQELVRQA